MLSLKAQDFKRLSITIILIIFPIISSCNDTSPHFKHYKQVKFKTPSKKEVIVYIAQSGEEQRLGLSGIKPEQLGDNEGMLFPSKKMMVRQFWMPETFMNLDLFFMNEEYYILEIHRDLQFFTKRVPESAVPRSKTVYSQHVLEMKSSSPLAKELEIGMKLDIK